MRGIINALTSYSIGTGGSRDSNLSTASDNDNHTPAVKIQRLARADFQTSRVYAEQGPLAVLIRNTRRVANKTSSTIAASAITSDESNNSVDDMPSATTSAKSKRLPRGSSVKETTVSNVCAEKQEWLLVLHENLLVDSSNVNTKTDHTLCLMREQSSTSESTKITNDGDTQLFATETSSFPVILGNEASNSTGERFVKLMMRLNDHLLVFRSLEKQNACCSVNELSLRGLCESVTKHPHWSPMHIAAYYGWFAASRSSELLLYLNEPTILSSDERRGDRGELPVMLAIQQGHMEVVRSLLEAGANILAVDTDGNTAYHYAVRSQQPTMVEIIAGAVKHQGKEFSLELVNCINIHGHAALYVAAHGKRCNRSRLLCEALMRAGAETSCNLMTSAGRHSHSNVVELGSLLCKMFPDLMDVNAARNGGSVFHWCRSRDAVLKFIDLGVSIEDADEGKQTTTAGVNNIGETPLFCAVKTNRLDVCVTLLTNGAVVNARDRDGLTPLHVAVGCITRHISHSIVRCLVAFGADVSLKAGVRSSADEFHSGKTAVDIARLIENEHTRSEVLLILSVGRHANRCAYFDDAELFIDKIRIEDMPGHSGNDMHLEYDYIEQFMCKFSEHSSGAVDATSAQGLANPPFSKKYRALKPQSRSSPTKTLSVVNSMATKIRGKLRGGSSVSSMPSTSVENAGKTSPPRDVEVPTSFSAINNADASSSYCYSGCRLETVLSLDGGGIKGINHVLFLMDLEERVGVGVVDMFDWIAGTSTGGILAIMLARGLSLRQCLLTYLQVKDRVFRGKRPYSAEALEMVLEAKIGHDTRMSQLHRPKLLIPACVADRHPPGVHFFSNLSNWTAYEQLVPRAETKKGKLSTLRQQLPPEQQIAWKAARSTGAAPTYFNSFEAYVDGGLVANNPTLDALAEILEYNHVQLTAGPALFTTIKTELLNTANNNCAEYGAANGADVGASMLRAESELAPKEQVTSAPLADAPGKVRLCCVVSLGCGKGPVAALDGNIDLCRPETLWDVNSLATLAGSMNTMTRMIIEQATSTDGRQVSRARAWCRSLKVPYYRFTPRFSQHVTLDCTDDERLIQMMWETRVYLRKQHRSIEQLARLLKTMQQVKQ